MRKLNTLASESDNDEGKIPKEYELPYWVAIWWAARIIEKCILGDIPDNISAHYCTGHKQPYLGEYPSGCYLCKQDNLSWEDIDNG